MYEKNYKKYMYNKSIMIYDLFMPENYFMSKIIFKQISIQI